MWRGLAISETNLDAIGIKILACISANDTQSSRYDIMYGPK